MVGTKTALFDEDLSDGSNAEVLTINKEYARRFEHNKKREELHKLEEKYKKEGGDNTEDESNSSDSETEDEDAFLATEEVDAEINAVLAAIKNKDPRLKDKNYNWYPTLDNIDTSVGPKAKMEKAVTLRDYHRMNLLSGKAGEDEEDEAPPRTYAQEQEDLKKSIANVGGNDGSEAEDDDGDFFKPKKQLNSEATAPADDVHPERAAKLARPAPRVAMTEDDVANADKDPDAFLDKYMASRAWVSDEINGKAKWQSFDSDDDSEDERMDQIEQAYNMRFEDPEKSNEVLRTYARSGRSVRRDKPTARQQAREAEKARKKAEKKVHSDERARLRRLKIEENEEKLRKIKKAAGMSGKVVDDAELMQLLEDAWDNDKWEEEMARRFSDAYYAEADDGPNSDDEEEGHSKKKKPEKPKWDDDIDIKDIIPDFKDDETIPAGITLSDDEDPGNGDAGVFLNMGSDEEDEEAPTKKRKSARDRKKELLEEKRTARRERAKVEVLVDSKMDIDEPATLFTQKNAGIPAFRYRETSPNSFGMTARDILLAPSDAALNQFAGLKKLAAFRDEEKKRKDRKKLGKKARLRQWRKEVYGDGFEKTGPTFGFEKFREGGETFEDKEIKLPGYADGSSSKKRKAAREKEEVLKPGDTEEFVEKKKKRRRKGKKDAEAIGEA